MDENGRGGSVKKLFDEIRCLEGEKIILRKITENDKEALREMAQSHHVYRYEPTYLLEQQYTDMDQLIRDIYGEYFETDIEIITASTMVENKASAHVLEKNGFMSTHTVHKEDWGHDESTDAYRWFL